MTVGNSLDFHTVFIQVIINSLTEHRSRRDVRSLFHLKLIAPLRGRNAMKEACAGAVPP